MIEKLSEIEIRILGALMEKKATTPEYYPLSQNALLNACNQRSNRNPVMTLTDAQVSDALLRLKRKLLVTGIHQAGGRTLKYKHVVDDSFNLTRAETAVLAILFLRGAQTPGEIKGRTTRILCFESLGELHETLEEMMGRESPLIKELPRQPGQKEARFRHLLGIETGEASNDSDQPEQSSHTEAIEEPGTPREDEEEVPDRVTLLETRVDSLEEELTAIKEAFQLFRTQFE